MKCPECVEEGKGSIVIMGLQTKTLMHFAPFYDKEGRCHTHDRNTTTQSFSCSNGHTWQEGFQNYCWCGWPGMIWEAEGPRVERGEVNALVEEGGEKDGDTTGNEKDTGA